MPKKQYPEVTNNYMVYWHDGHAPHWVEFLGRDYALEYYRKVKEKYPISSRLYRMVIERDEKV